MYRSALVSGFVNILVFFKLLDRFFFQNLRFLRLTFLFYDVLVARLMIHCKAVKKGLQFVTFLSEVSSLQVKASHYSRHCLQVSFSREHQ